MLSGLLAITSLHIVLLAVCAFLVVLLKIGRASCRERV